MDFATAQLKAKRLSAEKRCGLMVVSYDHQDGRRFGVAYPELEHSEEWDAFDYELLAYWDCGERLE